MTNTSKTYKIQLFHRILYSCSFDVLNVSKSPLLKAYLIKELGSKEAAKLDIYPYHELMEHMIMELKKEVEKSSYFDVSSRIRFHERYLKLRDAAKQRKIPNELVIANFRIHSTFVKEVTRLKTNTLGEVIEQAIALHAITCDEKTFELIYFAFINYEL